MKVIKVGMIGCGKQASKHLSSLKNIPGVEIVLADIEISLALSLAEEEGLECYEDIEQVFLDPIIKAIVICTPTPTHVPLIKQGIERGKDIFCEKPLSDSVEEIIELYQVAKKSSSIIMLGYIYRFVPVFEEGYNLFRKRKTTGDSLIMGESFTAFFRLGGRGSHRAWKHKNSEGGGAINEMLVHMMDLANWYFGPLNAIEVLSCDIRNPVRVIQDEIIHVDAEDFILVRAFGDNGTEIFCQADLITPAFSQYVEIQSENGSFMGSIQQDLTSYLFLKESRGGYNSGKTVFNFPRRNLFDIQMLAFIQTVITKQSIDRNTIEDSLELAKIMQQIKIQMGK